jgi:hypothetical protein
MPGQTKCFQCGSILNSQAATVDVHPPRMAPWKKPFRNVTRWMRRHRMVPTWSPPECISSRIKTDSVDYSCLRGLFLSIIPGLAHLIHHRFREIRWYFLGWLIALSIGLFLYGYSIGLCFVGLAVGLHAWIAVQHSLMKHLGTFGERLGALFITMIILALIYWATPRVLLSDLTGGYTSLTLPYQNVQRGDYLLAWRNEPADHPLPRGSLVLTRLGSVTVGRRTARSRTAGDMIVQIIGLPAETLQINQDVYIIDGRPLDSEKYPVPQWLHERKFSTTIPPDSYFVSSEYNIPVRGRGGIGDPQIRTVCVISFEAVRARAFMRWSPVSRRGFIEETE